MSPNRPICCLRTVLACRPIVCRPKNNLPKRLSPNWFFAQPSELRLGLGLGLAFWRIGFRRIGTEPLKMPFRDNRYSLITIICCEAVQYTILATAWLLV